VKCITHKDYISTNFDHIDFLINNAAQTVRRPIYYFKNLIEKESKQLLLLENSKSTKVECIQHLTLPKSLQVTKGLHYDLEIQNSKSINLDETDDFGEPLDKREKNTWNSSIDEIDPMEILEVQMINNVAPTLLVSKLMPYLSKKSSLTGEGYSHIINVTSDEGQFNTDYKSKYHSHTNISKAALNMLTRTSASLFSQKGILLNSVDPGWVSSTVPSFKKPVLDCEDGAARILQPILTNYQKYGKLLKNFKEIEW
jgi:NAD(P)-dependent dehydrogenase (short-subunit alcohol dehydrogenase family)